LFFNTLLKTILKSYRDPVINPLITSHQKAAHKTNNRLWAIARISSIQRGKPENV